MPSHRARASCRWALACLALTSPGLAQEPDPPVYGELVEVRTGFVRFFVPEGAPPPRSEELEVVADGVPQRIVRVVGGSGDPLELGVALDTSPSFRDAFAPLRSAALGLVDATLGPDDRLLAIGFAEDWRLLAEGRGEAMRVLAALPNDPEFGSSGTAFFAAVDGALGLFGNADARAALVVVSDGCNTVPTLLDAHQVAERARRLAIPIFLLLQDRVQCRQVLCARNVRGEWRCSSDGKDAEGHKAWSDTYPDRTVKARMRAADRTEDYRATAGRMTFAALIEEQGGGSFVVAGPLEWPAVLERIFERLARQWTVVFEPSSAEVRSDEVRVYARIDGKRRRVH
jgi:hypothetical protein